MIETFVYGTIGYVCFLVINKLWTTWRTDRQAMAAALYRMEYLERERLAELSRLTKQNEWEQMRKTLPDDQARAEWARKYPTK